MAMWHFYSCFTINLVIEMTDFLLSTHMRMFTWYISLYYGDMRHTPNSPFFHPSQSRLFFILLFSFRLIKFGLKFQYHSNLIILKIIDIFCCCWKYSIYTQFIFFRVFCPHRPTILLMWNHLYFCGGSILIREVHWCFFKKKYEKCSKGIKEPHSNLWIFFWKVFQEN